MGNEKREYYVLGVGSPHGEDQAGWLVVDLLRRRGVDSALAVDDVCRLLDYLPKCRRAILVDSCVSGAPAGTIWRLTWPDPRIRESSRQSSHGLDIRFALSLAAQLRKLPEEVVVFCMEIRRTEPGSNVSPHVRGAVELLSQRILAEITSPVHIKHA